MTIEVPAKVIGATASSITGVATWPYNNGQYDPYWSGGSSPKYYQWRVELTINEQVHSSFKTRRPYRYDGFDVQVGDYIADQNNGVTVKIITIESKATGSISCIVEDVLRYNTFRDPSQLGGGIFSAPTAVVIFELNEQGQPIIDPAPDGASATFFTNVSSHFQNLEKNYNFILDQSAHGFITGQVIAADPGSNSFVLADSGHPYVVGSVSNIDLGPDSFMINPFQKIVDDYTSLIGEVGDLLYVNTSEPGEYSLVGTQPVLIKLRQQTNSTVTGMTLEADANTASDASFMLNGVEIVVGNAGLPSDLVSSCNLELANTGVIASFVENLPSATTDLSLLNNFGVVVVALPYTTNINGTTVTFATTTSGSTTIGDGYADQYDIASDINAASISGVLATADGSSITLSRTSPGTISITNIGTDGLGNPFAGPNSSTGLPTSISSGSSYIKLDAVDARAIDLFDINGSPTTDFGLYSVENGTKAAALVIEQGIRQAASYVVADIPARDALEALFGDQAYVVDVGNGEWAFYIYTLDSEWVQLSNKDSSETDAQSVELPISAGSNASATIHTISNGRRVSFVTVTVVDPFNAPATVAVGDDSDNDRLMTADQNDLTSAGDYSTTPSYTYSPGSDTNIKYYFDASGATVGNAIVAITYT